MVNQGILGDFLRNIVLRSTELEVFAKAGNVGISDFQ